MVQEGCTSCGAPCPASARFCPACGAPQPERCTSCGTPLVEGARFCSSCGAPAGGTSGPPHAQPPPRRVAERRLTSVLFGDLVGFTTLSEVRDPEQVREILSRYFERSREVVARYDGVVEKFIGDAVMAVWGVPVAHEDDAERAVRAGTELVAMVAALGAELDAPLALRVGIVTGEVAVTIGATAEGMIAGDPVNTASRVQSTAEPGQVWVDAPTRSLTSSTVEYDDTGEHPLKGKAEPVRLYAVRAVHGDRVAVEGVQAPLVGRDRELALLRDLFSATAAEGRPRLVVVDGEAGVGKSRLVAEFQSWIDELDILVRWHRGRCLSYGDGIAFWALSEAVRTRIGLLEGDTGDTVVVRLDASLDTAVVNIAERDHLRPRLMALIAGSGERSFERGDLFASWTRFFELIGAGDPVVLVLDDAHHADDGLLDFVDHMMSTSRAPIFVLAMARSELLERRPGWGGRRAAVVPLGPLDADAMSALVESLVTGLPEGSRKALVASTGGLPLFAVETVRSLIDQGVVLVDEGRASVAGGSLSWDTVRAPESLRSLVTARLDSLGEDERRVVADASVLGLTFTLDGLVALGSDPTTLDSAVTALLNRELFTVESDRFSGERGQLRFVHAVVRQVAYGVLSRRDRKNRHLDAADFLLAQVDDSGDIDGLVAQHLLDALDAAFEQDDDVAVIRERAAAHLRTAGLRARTIGAPLQAFRLLTRCGELLSDEHAAAAVLVTAADAAIDAGEQDAAAALAESARDRLELLGDPVATADAVVVQARALTWAGRFSDLLGLLESRLPGIEATPGAEWATFKLLERSTAAYAQLGPLEREMATYRRIIDLGASSPDPAYRLGAYFAEAVLSQLLEDWTRMEIASEKLIELARSRGEYALSATGLANLCMLDLEVDLRRALARVQEGLAEARRGGLVSIINNAAVSVIEMLFELGDLDEAVEGITALTTDDLAPLAAMSLAAVTAKCARATGRVLSPAASGATSSDGYTLQLLQLGGRLEDELRARDGRDAAATASQAFADAAAMQQVNDMFAFLPPAIDAAVLSGEPALVASILELSTDESKVSTPRRRAFAAWGRGTVAAMVDEPSAPEQLAAAVEALAEFGTPGYAARARMQLGLLHARRGSSAAAAEELDTAAAEFRRMGAWGWLEELEAARSTPGP